MLVKRSVLKRRLAAVLLFGAGSALLAYAVWPWTPMARQTRPPRAIVFYGFSILGDVIDHGVFPEFQRQWRERTGEGKPWGQVYIIHLDHYRLLYGPCLTGGVDFRDSDRADALSHSQSVSNASKEWRQV